MHHIDFNKISTIAIDEVLGPLYVFDVFFGLMLFWQLPPGFSTGRFFAIDILQHLRSPETDPFTSNNAL